MMRLLILATPGMGFLDPVPADQGEMGVDPVGYARKARLVRDVYRQLGLFEDPLRVEGRIYLLVLREAVDVDARGRGVEIGADEGLVPRDVVPTSFSK